MQEKSNGVIIIGNKWIKLSYRGPLTWDGGFFLPPAPVRVSRVACCAQDVLLPPQQRHDHDAQDRRRFGPDIFSAIFSER